MIEVKEGSERSLININEELEAIVEYFKNNIQGWKEVSSTLVASASTVFIKHLRIAF